MKNKRTIRIGLLGFGTVGQGVWKHLQADQTALEYRLGAKLELVRAAARDLTKSRAVQPRPDQLTDDPFSIVDDPNIDIVCELIGGTTLARELTLRALKNGKTVVTANKALISEFGEEIFAVARESNTHYFFEASVAGGIPIIKTLREGLVANRFPQIYGILNGTSNYILTRMEREGLSFEDTLNDARALGYVEADESLDLDGWDAAHKAVILAYLAHGKWVKLDDMVVEGIRDITTGDIAYAKELGYKIKLLAVIRRDFTQNTVSVRLHPALIAKQELIAQVDEVFNGISLTGDVVGTTILVGRGAGQDATASAVISDIADAVAALLGAPPPIISEEDVDIYRALADEVQLAGPESLVCPYYIRLRVKDEPGVLARVAQVFADHGVSVATMIQQEEINSASARIIFTTHAVSEASLDQSLGLVAELPFCLETPFRLRVFKP
ncbi:homoserine dehydrogenase [Cerasicoccus arenae]|uniref:Homoserine dehydrogenase n=1 Tax=Cerasicoccus arenae TaxID=424488 RepID=A0A8J3GD79_9BACT|nr:homoserine dehydrogenase [Cerasicoccus arenae]MBK1856736.1 homoserine dehydrogenase [Cerasicoccus arenae]GHB99195.1 homoserine dehydrogenase [Cerasicoccus arenae]